MLEGAPVFNLLPLQILKDNFINFTSNLTQKITSVFSPSTTLIPPDQLFLSTKVSQNNSSANFSFVDQAPINKNIVGRSRYLAAEGLKRVSTNELKELGQKNKKEFFKTLLPAALEAEKIYGVPASVTLAQAALESGWGKHAIGGYNIFGIKGKGPAGSVNVPTKEFINGKYVAIRDNFAKYNDFYEAVMKHGSVFHARYKGYQKGLNDFAANKNDYQFIDNVGSTYATSPTYKNDIKKIMKDFDLVNMSKNYYLA